MLKEGEVVFNFRSSLDLNMKLENYPSIPVLNEDYEEIKIEGRNGYLYVNKGTFEDRNVMFEFTKISENIHLDFDEMQQWLIDIEDNKMLYGRSDRAYIVKKILFGDFQQEITRYGSIQVTFICEPFLSDVYETEYSIVQSGFNFYYGGTAQSDPIIKLYGSGNVQITINNETMQILNVNEFVTIDCDLMQVRDKNEQSKDFDTIGNFISLKKGNCLITYTGNISKVEFKYTTKYR